MTITQATEGGSLYSLDEIGAIGAIVIRDEAGQKALTGQTAAEAIAGLNRDTKDTLNALDRIFDEKEIRAGFEVTKNLAQETGTFLANRAAG